MISRVNQADTGRLVCVGRAGESPRDPERVRKVHRLGDGVTVAQQILVLFVMVRIHVAQFSLSVGWYPVVKVE
jgi:hypothetical protein